MTIQLDAYNQFKNLNAVHSVSFAILTYIGAFESRDTQCITTLVGDNALVEVPLLKPNRLFGSSEVERGHTAAFNSIKDFVFSIDGDVAAKFCLYIRLHSLITFDSAAISKKTERVTLVRM